MKGKTMFILSLIMTVLNGVLAIIFFASIFLSNSATADFKSIGIPILFLLISLMNFVVFLIFTLISKKAT